MKRLYLVSTAVFWIAVAMFWSASRWGSAEQSAAGTYTLDDLSTHDTAEDCWMAIGGAVYDLTAYLPQHPTRPEVIVPWCGEEATSAYNTKNRGQPHSAYASEVPDRCAQG